MIAQIIILPSSGGGSLSGAPWWVLVIYFAMLAVAVMLFFMITRLAWREWREDRARKTKEKERIATRKEHDPNYTPGISASRLLQDSMERSMVTNNYRKNLEKSTNDRNQ